ncbi:hypothetical protein GN958_ATG07139, partial [Phytophthora infestans]
YYPKRSPPFFKAEGAASKAATSEHSEVYRATEAKSTLRKALGDGDSSGSNKETEPTGTLAAGNYCVRSITSPYIRNGRRVYLTDWESTEEPADNLPLEMVAAFNRRRRAPVRRAFIEDEAGHTRERRRPSADAPRSRRRPLRVLSYYAEGPRCVRAAIGLLLVARGPACGLSRHARAAPALSSR